MVLKVLEMKANSESRSSFSVQIICARLIMPSRVPIFQLVGANEFQYMVAMDKTIERGGEESYEYKMKKVLEDMKAKPSIRANKDWVLKYKVSREGQEIIKDMVKKGEITQARGKRISPTDCRAPRVTGYPKIHKADVPIRGVVSFIGSPYEKIANELVPILRSPQGRTKHYLKKQPTTERRTERMVNPTL